MHRKRTFVAVAVSAAALLGAGTALAGMHAVLGAKLSGMGEHGIVNLQSNASKGKLCWTFEVPTKGITGASIRDTAGMKVDRAGHALHGEGLRGGRDEDARHDRVEARLVPGLGRHEGRTWASCAASCSPAWRTCR